MLAAVAAAAAAFAAVEVAFAAAAHSTVVASPVAALPVVATPVEALSVVATAADGPPGAAPGRVGVVVTGDMVGVAATGATAMALAQPRWWGQACMLQAALTVTRGYGDGGYGYSYGGYPAYGYGGYRRIGYGGYRGYGYGGYRGYGRGSYARAYRRW